MNKPVGYLNGNWPTKRNWKRRLIVGVTIAIAFAAIQAIHRILMY
jgi:hypothetical protein